MRSALPGAPKPAAPAIPSAMPPSPTRGADLTLAARDIAPELFKVGAAPWAPPPAKKAKSAAEEAQRKAEETAQLKKAELERARYLVWREDELRHQAEEQRKADEKLKKRATHLRQVEQRLRDERAALDEAQRRAEEKTKKDTAALHKFAKELRAAAQGMQDDLLKYHREAELVDLRASAQEAELEVYRARSAAARARVALRDQK